MPKTFEQRRALRIAKRLIPKILQVPPDDLAKVELVMQALLVATETEAEEIAALAAHKPIDLQAANARAHRILAAHARRRIH